MTKNIKVECPLWNDGETLQGPCVTVTQEEWDTLDEKMNDKRTKKLW